MIIENLSLGGDYLKVTTRVSGFTGTDWAFTPGSCLKVAGRYLAPAERKEEDVFTFVVKSDSFLLNENLPAAEPAAGTGFKQYDAVDVACLASGTGVGAFIQLASHRSGRELKTALQMVGRRIKKAALLTAFPQLESIDFGCWDTSFWGRPNLDTEVIPAFRDSVVLYAGCKHLLDDLRSRPNCPTIHLNF